MTETDRPQPTPWGTRRRLQALMNRGWSPRALQDATGLPGALITAAVAGKNEPGSGLDDRHVAAVYDWAWQRPPPQATPRDKQAAAAARDAAARNRWPPPMAWDDDIIDQPAARPAPGWAPSPTTMRKSKDLLEDLAWIRQQGGYRHAPPSILADRLGMTADAFDQACRRAAKRQVERELEAG
jgi:hypothetical protein